jgi:GT2 family glycosyltransferase
VTTAPEIGVAIATRDRPETLARCLDSLLTGQHVPAEVVVADQSAEQGTREVVESRRSSVPVRWVPGGDGGLAGAQNTAFRHSSTSVVAVIDDDCVADPGWIATLGRLFAADPSLALVGGRVLPLEPAGARRHPVSSRTGAARREFRGKALPWLVGSGNNFAVRREWFERVGGCDPRLGPGTPGQGALDMDLFYRVLRAGGHGRYDPGAVVHHERVTQGARRQRRWLYGHGVGAMCVIRLRERDLFGLRLLAGWVALRARLIGSGLLDGRFETIGEEALVLGGTAAGMAHAARLPGSGRSRA